MKKRVSIVLSFLLTGFVAGCTANSVGQHDAEKDWHPKVWLDYQRSGSVGRNLPDFSRAGYNLGEEPPVLAGPFFSVTDKPYGAVPDDGGDDTQAIQQAIDAAVAAGGGVVLLPSGTFQLRTQPGGKGLEVRGSGVVLRGAGDGSAGTRLHLKNPGSERTVRRLGSVPASGDPRSEAAIAILGPESREPLAKFTAGLTRGESVVAVDSVAQLQAGQMVVVACTDPLIDETNPAPEKADLVAQLTHPFQLTDQQVDTFGREARVVTWITRITEVINGERVRLASPARFDHHLRYEPRLLSFSGLQGVGIEDLRISSSWAGGYRHHKPFTADDGTVLRTAREQDYLWNGIWVSQASDGWVRGVSFENLTQGIIVSHSTNMTFERLKFYGQAGHAGVTLGRSNELLLRELDFYAPLVHPVTLTMMASGNVVTDVRAHLPGRDELSETDTAIDFHGLFPFENLFEQLTGYYICPGGDLSVLPHAGVRNVFWNISAPAEMSCYVPDEKSEFARTFAYVTTSTKKPVTMFEHFPQAFFVGITRAERKPLTIGGSSEDRVTPWLQVEGLNRQGLALPSLYQAQRQRRLAGQGFSTE